MKHGTDLASTCLYKKLIHSNYIKSASLRHYKLLLLLLLLLLYPISHLAILITGGLRADTKAEIYIPSRNSSCQLPDLPVRRYYHTQDGLLTCGGTSASQLCHTWDPETGTWPESHNLPTGRSELSWTPRSGNGTYLIGKYWENWDHAKTTTLAKPDGSVVPGFNVNRTE